MDSRSGLCLVSLQRGGEEATMTELEALENDGAVQLSVFQGASSGLIDDSDIADAGAVVEPGSSAGILVFENRWATPFVDALRRGGAELVAAGYIPQDALLASLDAIGD